MAREFYDFYRTQQQEFPPECRDADYEKRIKGAYPIHPEIFDRLYTDWSTLIKFQRTKVVQELDKRLRADLRSSGDFRRIHALPHSGQDVPDDTDARLVVLGTDYPYRREPGNPAEQAARAILESRGSAPRLYRNTLVFLAVDQTRLQDLDEAVRRFLAWKSIVKTKDELNLDPHQLRQAETQLAGADGKVSAQLPGAYQWLRVPVQHKPQDAIEWQALRLSGQDALAVRASRKLRNDEMLITSLAGTRLRLELDRVPLWRGDHVAIRQLAEDFVRYLYLPRLSDTSVLIGAIRSGLALLTGAQDSFAYAEGYDDAAGRYQGLRSGQQVAVSDDDAHGMLVKPDVASRQLDAERAAAPGLPLPAPGTDATVPGTLPGGQPTSPEPSKPKRFHGSVVLDPTRVGRDASRIADEVIAHLSGLVGANVKVTLEIAAEVPGGVPDNVVRTVTENSRTLKFTTQGFESE